MLSNRAQAALDNAAASSAMEGLPLTQENRNTIERILTGELTLSEYFHSIQTTTQGN